ncbi:SRPBCC family protein [Streptomyces sp. LHD-70]|uniref:SRPBCC family protein n=1 Tax=Streptomyces sp. LHD-70 TaxID=3072140 RepID=UPI00281014CC|nr:SRPBCC family protein [Streptomyces sp. LHD-70]MDQ8703186.1 SRPBCC family protein [Streptomyces sp. LHD-70]
MDWCHYRFRSVWNVPARPEAVFAVLENAEEYPRWWRQVREVVPIDDRSGRARFRSVLPYDLRVTAREQRRDPAGGILEIGMTGDLDGWARWTLTPAGGGTRVLYEQEVDVRRPLLRRFAVPGRPVFLLNHALMMRSGRRGLIGHLGTT